MTSTFSPVLSVFWDCPTIPITSTKTGREWRVKPASCLFWLAAEVKWHQWAVQLCALLGWKHFNFYARLQTARKTWHAACGRSAHQPHPTMERLLLWFGTRFYYDVCFVWIFIKATLCNLKISDFIIFYWMVSLLFPCCGPYACFCTPYLLAPGTITCKKYIL